MSGSVSRFDRSWLLLDASWNVLRTDRELLILPVISGVASAIVCAAFFGMAEVGNAFKLLGSGLRPPGLWVYAALFIFYAVEYFIIIFFNTALAGAALERFDGRDPTVRSALVLARSRIGSIFAYAIFSATVGVLLRIFATRLGLIGRMIASAGDLAWGVATFLVVPILAAEDLDPDLAIERSAALLKETWGENLIGRVSISVVLWQFAAAIAIVGASVSYLLYRSGLTASAIPLCVVTIVLFAALSLLALALEEIYAAALYRYAVSGRLPEGFGEDLINSAFRTKPA